MRRALATTALAAAAALALAGCSGGDGTSTAGEEATSPTGSSAGSPETSSGDAPAESPSESDDEAADTVFQIEIEGDRIDPQGKSVEVAAGKPITLEVGSDRAAELHVHSSPEQELEVDKGENTFTLVLDKPGLVDIEEHDTGLVILRLEVR